jgi:lipopolysaccharide biosynthesis glycosyltransferase
LQNEESLLHYFTLKNKDFCMGSTLYSLGDYSNDRHTEPTFLHYNGHKPWNPLGVPKYTYRGALHAVWRKAALDILGEKLYNAEIRSKFEQHTGQ